MLVILESRAHFYLNVLVLPACKGKSNSIWRILKLINSWVVVCSFKWWLNEPFFKFQDGDDDDDDDDDDDNDDDDDDI